MMKIKPYLTSIIIVLLQCHGSSGHCWCVDERGQERTGTRTPPGAPRKDCDRPGRGKGLFSLHPLGSNITYTEVELVERFNWLHIGYFYYVLTMFLLLLNPKSSDEPERPKTYCEQHKDSVQTHSPEGYPLLGVYVPQCDSTGQYTSQQVRSVPNVYTRPLFVLCYC